MFKDDPRKGVDINALGFMNVVGRTHYICFYAYVKGFLSLVQMRHMYVYVYAHAGQ